MHVASFEVEMYSFSKRYRVLRVQKRGTIAGMKNIMSVFSRQVLEARRHPRVENEVFDSIHVFVFTGPCIAQCTKSNRAKDFRSAQQ